MGNVSHSVADLLPHGPSMVLLDEVIDWQEGRASVILAIRPGIPFFVDPKGVPAHVGLEYMAQACGVYAGLVGLNAGEPIRLGFLLGTRNYRASVDWFGTGVQLVISVSETFRQESMGVFDCVITCNDVEVASAQLNLYRREDG
jgi:predicted hotdog family 3-hydroxylacyl-ACP dehydratase